MKSNKALYQRLSRLSPLFRNLVNMANELQVAIVTSEEYYPAVKQYVPNIEETDRFIVAGARDFADSGTNLGKIIRFEHTHINNLIAENSLGECEYSFAHELSHIINHPQIPECIKKSRFIHFHCCFSEAMADASAMDLIEKLHPEGKSALLQYKNSLLSPRDLLKTLRADFRISFSREAVHCRAVEFHKIPRCPKLDDILTVEVRALGQ